MFPGLGEVAFGRRPPVHPRSSAASVHGPIASCLSRRLSKISKEVWPRLSSNHCFCPGFCRLWDFVYTLQEFCLHLPPSSDSSESVTGLQSQMFWKFTFLMQDPQAGEPDIELRLFAQWEDCSHPLIYKLPTWRYRTTPYLCHSYLCHSHFSISLVVEHLFCWSSSFSHQWLLCK